MKTIPLTQGKVAIVDDEDFERLNKFKWQSNKGRSTFYATRHLPGNHRKLIRLHRELLGITDPKIFTDHINRNGLDNRKENLRICTNKQNRHNTTKRMNNTSGFKGVSFHKHIKKWQAQIGINGKVKGLGYFSCPEHAALAYNIAALNYQGEFAHISPILTPQQLCQP